MSNGTHPPSPFQGAPLYPGLADAKVIAEDFRTGAPDAYAKAERWAKYWWTHRLDILATQLKENIYTVIAYPPSRFKFAKTGSYDQLEYFRGWLLEHGSAPGGWKLRASSQDTGINEFIRLRRELKEG